MKALTVIIISSLGLSTVQRLKEADVPAAVKESFKKEFPDVKVKEWEKEHGNYEAEFDLDKTENAAVFSADGKLLETEQEITVNTLPPAVEEYVKKNHAGYKISEASKITEAGTGKVSYEAEIKKGREEWELIFDDKGNFLKKEGDKD